ITFSVTAVNDAPVANAVTRTTNEDTAVSVTLSGTDVENSTLSFTVLTQPSSGTLSRTAPNLTYTPAANFNGTDTFTYRVSDGSANSNTATVSLTITAVNDAPSFTLAGNPPASNPGAGLQTVANFATNISRGAANESSQTLTFNVTQLSNSGITFTTPPTINATTGALTYAVAANSSGTARFGVTLSDNGSGTSPNVNTSAQQTFEITVGLSTLSGSVFIDSDNDGVRDTGEIGLPNVTITLQGTSTGNTTIQRTTTTANDGTYQFADLPPGTYSVTETHPTMFLDGVERVGTAGGTAGSDQITGIVLSGNTNAQNYNFTERGLTASAVGLKMFLCSTPSGDVLIHQLLPAPAGNGNALRAASSAATNARGTSNAVVSAASVEPLVRAAIQQFADAGASAEQLARLSSAQVSIADLPGDQVGEAGGNAITLDANAAGLGWFIDATPTVDEEFVDAAGRLQATAGGDASGRMDALTAIAHEFGHLLGFEHSAGDEDSLMFEWLQLGQRKRVTSESLDDLFANEQTWDW
ncbi:MAG: cadherin-like domain-containing protein, partial [Planctomycetales bacterium]|nr:cadherin-like domain-containing protein [Planctomycetales bacterium]